MGPVTVVGFILIALAALLTLLLPPLAVSINQGHDAAAAGLQYFFVCIPRWLIVAIVLSLSIARGGFGWVSRSVAVQCLVVLALHVALGVVSGLSIIGMRDQG